MSLFANECLSPGIPSGLSQNLFGTRCRLALRQLRLVPPQPSSTIQSNNPIPEWRGRGSQPPPNRPKFFEVRGNHPPPRGEGTLARARVNRCSRGDNFPIRGDSQSAACCRRSNDPPPGGNFGSFFFLLLGAGRPRPTRPPRGRYQPDLASEASFDPLLRENLTRKSTGATGQETKASLSSINDVHEPTRSEFLNQGTQLAHSSPPRPRGSHCTGWGREV